MTEEELKKIEPLIADVMKPYEPKRPRIFPVNEPDISGWQQARHPTDAEQSLPPVRTLVQFLLDIEKRADDILERQRSAEKSLCDILKALDERLSRIENSISGQS